MFLYKMLKSISIQNFKKFYKNSSDYIIIISIIFTPPIIFFLNNFTYQLKDFFLIFFLSILIFSGLMFFNFFLKYFTKKNNFIIISISFFWFFQLDFDNYINIESSLVTKQFGLILILILSIFLGFLSHKKNFKKVILLFLGFNILWTIVINNNLIFNKSNKNLFLELDEIFIDEDYTKNSFKKKNNIYYVILDSMMPLDFINQEYKLNTRHYKEELIKLNFKNFENSISSYDNTNLSIASIFFMQKLPDKVINKDHNIRNFFPSIILPDKNHKKIPLIHELMKLNYKFIHVGNNWEQCKQSKLINCIYRWEKSNNPLINIKNNYHLNIFFKNSLISKLLRKLEISKDRNLNDALNETMKFLENNSEILTNENLFFFIHHFNPHPPFTDVNCNLKDPDNYKFDSNFEYNYNGYRESSVCTMKRMISFAKLISQIDSEGIIVFQGDHGSLLKNEFEFKRKIINSIKFPNNCYDMINDNPGNIETINFVINCVKKIQ